MNRSSCRLYLWDDHVVDALRYHLVPEDVILKMSPKKRRQYHGILPRHSQDPKDP